MATPTLPDGPPIFPYTGRCLPLEAGGCDQDLTRRGALFPRDIVTLAFCTRCGTLFERQCAPASSVDDPGPCGMAHGPGSAADHRMAHAIREREESRESPR